MAEIFRLVRLALRRLERAPLFASISILTLAVGIGATAAIFSVVDGVLFKPLPYPRAEELVSLWHTAPGLGIDRFEQSLGTYFTYRAENRVFEDVGLWSSGDLTATGVAEPERVSAIRVTDGTLGLLGARAGLGRLFAKADDAPGAPATVVLGHGYWQRRFGGDRGVIGRVLQLNGGASEIIGVLPRDFRLLDRDPDLYVAARFDPAQAQLGNFSYEGLARLRPGATPEQADADLRRMFSLAVERYPGPISAEQIRGTGIRAFVVPLKADLVGGVSTQLWVLLGAVGLVLLLACANVANLFQVQAEGRQREVAVRSALGAARRQIVAGFLTESLVLGGIAGAVGLALAFGGLRLLLAMAPAQLPRLSEIAVDGRVLGFTLLVSLAASLVFGLFPALRSARGDLHAALKEGGRGAGVGRQRHRVRNGLVVVQVALALVLLIGSGLMVRSVRSLRAVDPGFGHPEEVLAFRVFIPEAEAPEAAGVLQVEREIQDRLSEVRGVRAVGATSVLTLSGELSNSNPVLIEGEPAESGRIPPVQNYRFVAPGFHETMESRLLAGRMLRWADVDSRARVVVVNETLARAHFGEPRAAIGRRLRDYVRSPWHEVVGVVGDIRYSGVSQAAPPAVYWPLAVEGLWESVLWVPRALDYVVRTSGDPKALAARARDAVWSVNRNLALTNVRTLREMLDGSLARTAFTMVMLSIAAAVALVLGLVGISGVVSYIVAQRTQEIGVRIAIGAAPGAVRRMVMRETAAVTALGLGIGLIGAAGLSRLMAGLLHGVEPVDPFTYAAVTLVIAAVALMACWLPARRAAGVDPVTALKAE